MAEEKMKILYLMRILLEETDQDHILNAEQLCQKMESRYSLTCNRKTIYSDIDRLKKYGLMVQQLKGDRQGYYAENRKRMSGKIFLSEVQHFRLLICIHSEGNKKHLFQIGDRKT